MSLRQSSPCQFPNFWRWHPHPFSAWKNIPVFHSMTWHIHLFFSKKKWIRMSLLISVGGWNETSHNLLDVSIGDQTQSSNLTVSSLRFYSIPNFIHLPPKRPGSIQAGRNNGEGSHKNVVKISSHFHLINLDLCGGWIRASLHTIFNCNYFTPLHRSSLLDRIGVNMEWSGVEWSECDNVI